ncbi:MAG TPA: metal-sulfur cluster assembly factor [Chloroflexota bacterium]|nr:metal-sulfur cluster assembly factor [Chloroflexota bacterium]
MAVEMSTEEMVREALRENVIDPEIGVNVVDLGLVYDIAVKDATAEITMTLTTPMCPLGPYLDQEVRTATQEVPGVENIAVNLVWTPPWDPSMMSEDAKLELGFW